MRSQRIDVHPFTHSPRPVIDYALSPDRTMLAHTRRDASGLPHLFLNIDVSYERQAVSKRGNQERLGPAKLWSVSIDGSGNSPF